MSRQLTSRPNLEYLKKQAKELLEELQRQDPSAQLADAQHAFAREYGCASWPALTVSVEDRLAALARGVRLFAGVWKADPLTLQAVGVKDGQVIGGATYAVSPDGETLTVAADQQLIVLQRVSAA